MNTRRDNIRHFRTRMAIYMARAAEDPVARPLWVLQEALFARQYIWCRSFGALGMDPVDAARIMRALGMGKKFIRRATTPPAPKGDEKQ